MVAPVRSTTDGALRGEAMVERTGASKQPLSLASVMGPPCCHEHGTTWKC